MCGAFAVGVFDYAPPKSEHHARSKPCSHERDLKSKKMRVCNNKCISIWSTRTKNEDCIYLAAIMFQLTGNVEKIVFQFPRGNMLKDNECIRFWDMAGYPATALDPPFLIRC